ncbi:MAG: TRAFs-binding domain-containing protein [Actinomycetota bacterium]|nr:TRAFs-binding domain-containing protein [Actinomycetota bacterium]
MSDQPGFRPMVFVAMPFGKKTAPSGLVDIDFDAIYNEALRPAVADLAVEMIRADEERTGGFIHQSMYERLLLAEVVIADLTLANPNVFYELGIRHAARPRSTILISAEVSQLPFDVEPLRALSYELTDGRLDPEAATRLRNDVHERVELALSEKAPDSPLFQLINDYPGIDLPHDVTETFRDRARKGNRLHEELRELRRSADKELALRRVREIEDAAMRAAPAATELLVDLLLTYRDLSGYDDMVRCVGKLPAPAQDQTTIREQLAFALNRRNGQGDRDRAQRVLEEVIEEHGPSAETYGLLGRIHKDRFEAAVESGDEEAADVHLDEAIEAYTNGFEADPRDYYPGVNALTLLIRKGTPESLAQANELVPVVRFAVGRRGASGSSDYWDVATALELAVIARDERTATRAAVKMAGLDARDWMYETTIRNLGFIREAYEDDDPASWMAAIEQRLRNAMDDPPEPTG